MEAEIIGGMVYSSSPFSYRLVADDARRISMYCKEYWDLKERILQEAKEGEGCMDVEILDNDIAEILRREGYRVREKEGGYRIEWRIGAQKRR